MQCSSCGEEIPTDSLFCPECGARQNAGVGGINPSPAPPSEPSPEMQIDPSMFQQQAPQGMDPVSPRGNVQVQPNNMDSEMVSQNFLSSLAADMTGQPVQPNPQNDPSRSTQDMVVDAMAEAEREKKANARSAWLSMNQQSASEFLGAVGAVQGAPNVDRSSTSLDEVEPFNPPPARSSTPSNLPSDTLVRRMVEVAVRRVGRKRGVGVETPQVKAEGSVIRVNVTYVDDGRVLDNPPELHGAFEHAIDTEIRLKGYDVELLLALFRSKDGVISFSWGDEPESTTEEIDEEMFECGACGGLVHDSDPSCPSCGAEFLDEDEEPEPAPQTSPSRGGPPSSGPKGPSRGGPPSSGSKGPSRGGPPSSGPKGPSRGGPPSSGPKKGGPPSGPKKGGPKGPKRKGPPR
ncbi:MAG TPA: zinc-ribbon domain-containing protein [Candidatus Thalassarchaeaceae archaeon]|nr:zinc-ribbon domain-containing protein [Candidatus Thalassarchaeaceae archaeon]